MKNKSYKFRIYPNKTQQVLLNKTFGCVRYAWNSWVQNFNLAKDKEKVFKTPKEFRKELNWMKEISAGAIGQKEQDFRYFKQQFFNKYRKKKLGKPKFKSRKDKQSYRLHSKKFSINQENNKIRLEKIGWIKTIVHRIIPKNSELRSITISKDKVGSYFASILVNENIEHKVKNSKSIGLDFGIKSLVVTSSGEKFELPDYISENQVNIVKIQKHLSRKIIASKRYIKTKTKLAKLYRKVVNQRTHFLHNLSTNLIENYDVITIEDLNVIGMLKNHNLARSIQNSCWSELRRQLEYKSDWYGKSLVVIDRFEPTSKTCNNCGYKNDELKLSDREWICPSCSTVLDRDTNAAKNILSAGIKAELQTQREYKTLRDSYLEAVPVEALKNLKN